MLKKCSKKTVFAFTLIFSLLLFSVTLAVSERTFNDGHDQGHPLFQIDFSAGAANNDFDMGSNNIQNVESAFITTLEPTGSQIEVTGDLDMNGNDVLDAGGYFYQSDIRLKDNVEKIKSPGKKILEVDGIKYELGGEEKIGFSAQQIQEVYPELVKEGSDGYKRVEYTGMIPPLLEGYKEQQERIEELEDELEETKEMVNELKETVGNME